jgi:choline dehydrogenase
VVEEVAPRPATSSPDDVIRYALQTGAGIYHAVGSCAMGPRGEDVVDHRLCVRGVKGLRIVDASVLPTMLSGGTAAPTMAVAWRAAELIADA